MTPYTPTDICKYDCIVVGDLPAWEVSYYNYRNEKRSACVGGVDDLGAYQSALKTLGRLKARADRRRARSDKRKEQIYEYHIQCCLGGNEHQRVDR